MWTGAGLGLTRTGCPGSGSCCSAGGSTIVSRRPYWCCGRIAGIAGGLWQDRQDGDDSCPDASSGRVAALTVVVGGSIRHGSAGGVRVIGSAMCPEIQRYTRHTVGVTAAYGTRMARPATTTMVRT